MSRDFAPLGRDLYSFEMASVMLYLEKLCIIYTRMKGFNQSLRALRKGKIRSECFDWTMF